MRPQPDVSRRLWFALASATYPRWLYDGPYWWRSVNAWWLQWWGWAFYYSKPWRPGSVEDLPSATLERERV